MDHKPTLRTARESANKQLHHFLATSRNHPNPEHGRIIRTVCTRAILDLSVARSIEQIADIFEKAQDKLNKAKQNPLTPSEHEKPERKTSACTECGDCNAGRDREACNDQTREHAQTGL